MSGKPVWRAGKKKGYVGCSVTCPHCEYAASFTSYQQRPILTVHGQLKVRRAYYYWRSVQAEFHSV